MKIKQEIVGNEIMYVVSSSHFPHLMSQGSTLEKALDNFDRVLLGSVTLAKAKGFEGGVLNAE